MTIAPTDDRRLPVAGTYNLRDTGGYPAAGGSTRWGRLFRSDALHNLTAESRRSLADLGITTVVDLRTPDELRTAPSGVDGAAVTVHHVPIFDDNPATASLRDVTLERVYDAMIEQGGANLARAAAVIAAAGEGAVLVHCTAGKDRTGVLVALVLLAVGVEREAVVADYAATEANLAGEWADGMLAALRSNGFEPDAAAVELISASPAALIEHVIDRVEAGWGSAAGYLRAGGLADAELDALRTALIHPAQHMTAQNTTRTATAQKEHSR